MIVSKLLLGAAAIAMLAVPAFAEDYAGGAGKTMSIGGANVLTDTKGTAIMNSLFHGYI